ncbi:MAG: hypothetical protein HC800_13260 [Phormidesmis sp. RL_2_1]|nr:hypothetical protein [Phormidesmis sp. RL_2_1]
MHIADGEATPTGTRASLGPVSRHGVSQHTLPQPSDQSDMLAESSFAVDDLGKRRAAGEPLTNITSTASQGTAQNCTLTQWPSLLLPKLKDYGK